MEKKSGNVETIKQILLSEASPKIEGLSVTGVALKIMKEVRSRPDEDILPLIHQIIADYIYPKNSMIYVASKIQQVIQK